MSNLTITAGFTKNTSQPAQSLTLADIDLYLTRQHNDTLVYEVIWNGTQHPTVEVDNIGYYARLYSGANLDTYTYYARASYTGATVLDANHVTGVIGRSEATLTTAGATLAFGDLCYFAVADSRWELADADAEATTFGKLGICVLAAASDGSATRMLLYGKVRADTAFPALTVGAPAYVGTTAGDIQVAAPTGTGDCIRAVGQANTANELHFCPSPDWFEHS